MSTDHPRIEIWSHARAPPLRPVPNLAFDCRKINNPPKDIRDKYDGRSKRLKEHLLHDSAFIDLLDSAVIEITEAYERYTRDAAASDAANPQGENAEEETHGSRGVLSRSDDDNDSDGIANLEASSQDSDDEPRDQGDNNIDPDAAESPVIRISCSCVRGRHRSVAFAEELAQRLPASWTIQVRHRDVFKTSSDRKHRDSKGRGRGLSHMRTDQDEISD